MNFIKGMLDANGMGAVETVSTLASGDSLAEAGKNVAKRALSKKFEKILIDSADSYVAGYSSNLMAMLGVAGISAGVGATTWGSMKALNYFNDQKEEEDRSENMKMVGAAAPFAAFVVFAIVFATIMMTRRQRMFTEFAGTNMVNQYVKFFTIPFVFFFILWRVVLPSDKFKIHHVAAFAAGFAGVVLSLVKRFYLVYKLNDMEKDVFSSLATVFDACKEVGAKNCDHEHAGFVRLFEKVSTMLQLDMKRIWGELDYGGISREISKSQKFDTIAAFTG